MARLGGIVKRIPAYAGMTSPLRRQGLAMVLSGSSEALAKAFGLDAATRHWAMNGLKT